MQSRTDLVVDQTAHTPILTIPDVTEGSVDFKQRLSIVPRQRLWDKLR